MPRKELHVCEHPHGGDARKGLPRGTGKGRALLRASGIMKAAITPTD